ncbi:hypothetical protein [Paeniglutamicibacter antarcticus]|uniref:Uncharacterized protein n=1 Tax=Paeniglutamicibacter antarcticus TaxID=494023 RepID=A0ABP9TIP5_9MICC
MGWKRVNVLGAGLTGVLTASILVARSARDTGGFEEFRMVNIVLLIGFSFAVLVAVGCALGMRLLRLSCGRTCLMAVLLAWALSPPVAAWINMGGPSAEAFEPALVYWAWAALPALAYVGSIGMLGFFGPQRPPDASSPL